MYITVQTLPSFYAALRRQLSPNYLHDYTIYILTFELDRNKVDKFNQN